MGNMLKDAVKVFQEVAVGYEPSELMAAQDKMDIIGIGKQVLKKTRIPVLTDDEDVKRYVREFELDKPENMIRFFVEANFAAFELTKESINELKELDLINTISGVESAKDKITDTLNNKEYAERELPAAKDRLDDAANKLMPKISLNIRKIREIDNRPKFQFFIKSKLSLTDIDTAVSCAKLSLRALIEAVEAQRHILAIKKQTNDPASVKKCIQFIQDEILNGDTCSLMHAYDKDKAKGFWLNIRQMCQSIAADENYLAEFADTYADIEF